MSRNFSYLSRYKPIDPALTPNLIYTGFLIVRVDRDSRLQSPSDNNTPAVIPLKPEKNLRNQKKRTKKLTENREFSLMRNEDYRIFKRHVSSDPAYGFSNYFKPVKLQDNENSKFFLNILIIFRLCFGFGGIFNRFIWFIIYFT